MARRRNAAAPREVAEEPQQQEQQPGHAGGKVKEKRGELVQRRRGDAVAAQVQAAQAAAAEDYVDPVEAMGWFEYYPRQYGGLALGTAACCNTVVFYDQHDPWMVSKLLAWMFLALLGLAIHEYRPFKRMTYQDKAQQNGVGWRHVLGI